MPQGTDQIEQRIFECIEGFNFDLVASVMEQWEILPDGGLHAPSAEELRTAAISDLGSCYQELANCDDDQVEWFNGKLHSVCYRTEDGDFHFLLRFILSEGCSEYVE